MGHYHLAPLLSLGVRNPLTSTTTLWTFRGPPLFSPWGRVFLQCLVPKYQWSPGSTSVVQSTRPDPRSVDHTDQRIDLESLRREGKVSGVNRSLYPTEPLMQRTPDSRVRSLSLPREYLGPRRWKLDSLEPIHWIGETWNQRCRYFTLILFSPLYVKCLSVTFLIRGYHLLTL